MFHETTHDEIVGNAEQQRLGAQRAEVARLNNAAMIQLMHEFNVCWRKPINPASATVPIEANTEGRRYTSAEAFWPTSHIHNEQR